MADRIPLDPNGFRDLRASKGFTQESLALAAGVSVRTIRYIEGGRGSCSARILHKIAEALAVPAAELEVDDSTGAAA